MIDPRKAVGLGGDRKRPDMVEVTHPQTGEVYEIPQVAVAMIADNLINGLAQVVTQNVVINVVTNVLQALKDRCHFPLGKTAMCGVTRVMHNLPGHDFVEPPPPVQPTEDPTETTKEEKTDG